MDIKYSKGIQPNEGDCVFIDSIPNAFDNLKEFMVFVSDSFVNKFHVVSDDKQIDTRKSYGEIFRQMIYAINEFDESEFRSKTECQNKNSMESVSI